MKNKVEVGETVPAPRVLRIVHSDNGQVRVVFSDGTETITDRNNWVKFIQAVDPPRELP